MRILKFIVDGQVMRIDPSCDFSNLVPGSEGHLQAEFVLSAEWQNTAIAVTFWSMLGVEYPPTLLGKDCRCAIPNEATKRQKFKVQLIGQTKDGIKIVTNKVMIDQNGGMT